MNSIYLIVHEKVQDCYAKNIIEKHDKIVFSEFNLKNMSNYDDWNICEFLEVGTPVGSDGNMLAET